MVLASFKDNGLVYATYEAVEEFRRHCCRMSCGERGQQMHARSFAHGR